MTTVQYEEFPTHLGKIEILAFLDGGFFQNAGYFSDPHEHSFSEMVYVAEGNVVIKTAERENLLSKGDILILPQGTEHAVRSTENASFTFLAFWDKSHFFGETALISGAEFGEAFMRLLGYYYGASRYRYELIQSCLIEIFAHLIDALHKTETKSIVHESGSNTRFYTVEYYMRTAFKESPTLGDLAELLHLSIAQTDRTVRKLYGMSFGEKILAMRIEEAKKLLLETDLPITKIATSLGYSATHNFYSTFKKATGKTPKEFRIDGRENASQSTR